MQICKTVTIRKRAKKNGTYSLYLDFYPGYRNNETMELIRRQKLGIYIYIDPQDEYQKEYNATMLQKAEAIRCRVFEQVINEKFEFFDRRNLQGDFLAYYKSFLRKKNEKWIYVYRHFEKFVNGKCTCEEVNVHLCRKFQEYLLKAKSFTNGQPLSVNSAAGYWSTFRGFLAIAYREHKIKENVNDYLDKINYIPIVKETLTLEELRTLYNTPCSIDILKRAAIFSCLTGIRRSDIMNLKWKSIHEYSDGNKYVEFISQKTKARNVIPLSKEAYELLPDKTGDKVFNGFTNMMTVRPLQEWLYDAGINKHITFHCFRHTFASLQIEMGTDIYTIQELLAHKNVSTTQIYAQHSDIKKREAANKIVLKKIK